MALFQAFGDYSKNHFPIFFGIFRYFSDFGRGIGGDLFSEYD
ncbi:hypothetical protein SMSK564_0814 [Streptococcus mitis SK564]|uniref:Uncharacterized protein n=1 Tax=Streptococcus mitis SK564 TaxID=585203 RepID=E1LMW1_STRMT|nr:hypothetical protein SMSK564_0814 [Streptococcus mitis SK564]